MNFLAPAFLAGALLASVPIAIHLIGKRRAKRVRFAAMVFLVGQRREIARKTTLRKWLLLCARALAVVAIALTLAQPFRQVAGDELAVAAGPQAVVIVIDNSMSMSYRLRGSAFLDRGKARAKEILAQLGGEAEVALLEAAIGTEGGDLAPIAQLTRDHIRVEDAIDAVAQTSAKGDLHGALRRAAAILERAPDEAKRVYLLTDPQGIEEAAQFQHARSKRGDVEVIPIDLAGGAELANVGILSARAQLDPRQGARGVEVVVDILNYGNVAVRGLPVTLTVDRVAVARGLVDVAPGERAVKRFSYVLSRGGTFDASVEIASDALALDDRRYLRIDARTSVRVLLVNGDPRAVDHEDELFYVATALRPGDRSDSALETTTISPEDLLTRSLDDVDVILLANVPAPSAPIAAQLEAFVRRGGGLLIGVGDHVVPEEYAVTMRALMPQSLSSMRVVADVPNGPQGSLLDSDPHAEQIDQFDGTHPIFQVFAPRASELRGAHFARYFLLGPEGALDGRKTLATLSSGAPLLVEGRLGNGRLLLFAATLDRDWTSLPIHAGFLPLMQQSIRYLARASLAEPEPPSVVGDSREVDIGEGATRIEIVRPSGKRTSVDRNRIGQRTRWTVSSLFEPGIYAVSVGVSGGLPKARSGASFAVNTDPAESVVRPIKKAVLPSEAPAQATEKKGPPPVRQQRWAHWVSALVLCALCFESFLSRRS